MWSSSLGVWRQWRPPHPGPIPSPWRPGWYRDSRSPFEASTRHKPSHHPQWTSPRDPDIRPAPGQCWSNVRDIGPALSRCWAGVSSDSPPMTPQVCEPWGSNEDGGWESHKAFKKNQAYGDDNVLTRSCIIWKMLLMRCCHIEIYLLWYYAVSCCEKLLISFSLDIQVNVYTNYVTPQLAKTMVWRLDSSLTRLSH